MKKSGNSKGASNKLSLIVLVLVLLVGIFFLLINYITDWLWFKEMGYVDVFFKQLFTQLKVGIPIFVVLFFISYLYLKKLKKGYFKKIVSREATDLKKLNKYTMALSSVFGLVVSFLFVNRLWFQILQYANASNFDFKDPLFNLDISFYVFKLNFLKELNVLLIGVVIALVALTLVYYLILLTMHSPDVFERDNVSDFQEAYQDNYDNQSTTENNPFKGTPFEKVFDGFSKNKRPKAKRQLNDNNFKELFNIASGQLTLLGIIFFLMVALDFFLKQFDLLHSHNGSVYGASFVDVNVTLWIYRILGVLAVLGAISVGHFIRKKSYKKILYIPVAMIVIGALGTGAGILVQNMVVSPDEINKEEKYYERNIEYTQRAYQLDDVKINSFAANNELESDDIAKNNETIRNIRINDYQPVEKFYNQTQKIRNYYTFNDVDVDRYMVNGKYTQTYLSTREIDESKLNQSWLNQHIKYTHGYGITLSRVDAVTPSGQPEVMIKNIPPVSKVKEITVDQPEIYFGELSNNYVLVNTDEDEFDYPDGDKNKYSRYEGNAGIELNLVNRLMFSIREGSLKLLVSSNINNDSKIIINRNVMNRVRKIMPHLSYENDPYSVVADGKIYWMVDAYTTSGNYPYAEPYMAANGTHFNYIRNSIKVVVDAYNGEVNFYLVNDEDPIANTFAKIYPTLFKSADKMPESLKSHIRYPNTLFEIQANIFTRYHMDDVKVFYQNEDIWDIANQIYGTKEVPMTPNYYIVKLPGEESAEFVSSIPFTPKATPNMSALFFARNDGENYGELVLYTFPKNKTVYGPMQIEAQIDQSTEISKEFSLWNSSGSTYSRGNLFIVPIEESLIYIEPVYLEASNSAIPEVKRVIVAYGDKIAYEPTLGAALESLFGKGTGIQGTTPSKPNGENDDKGTMSQTELINEAVKAFNDAENAQKSGNWAEYGEHLKTLEDYLKKLSN